MSRQATICILLVKLDMAYILDTHKSHRAHCAFFEAKQEYKPNMRSAAQSLYASTWVTIGDGPVKYVGSLLRSACFAPCHPVALVQ